MSFQRGPVSGVTWGQWKNRSKQGWGDAAYAARALTFGRAMLRCLAGFAASIAIAALNMSERTAAALIVIIAVVGFIAIWSIP